MNSATASLPLMLKQLRLSAVTEQWEAIADKALHDQWRPEQYLSELCHIELASRTDKRQMRYIKESLLPSGKHLGGFDFTAIEGLNKARMYELADNHDWVRQGANLLLFGASGVGKTHLASSLGYSLIEAGTRVKFYSASALVQQLQEAKQSLKLQDALNKLDKYPALIIDDIGYVKKTEQETNVLFELIAHRYERHSLIITSNQSFEDWDELFTDTTMTVAAIDRLVHHAHIIQLTGESYRRKTAMKEGK
jgi:DNA replication protein DnaC|tara:strand:+ start:1460 stop:2212 length:753 start_codon:yes stop_codon:yes gene_type:complete